MFGQLLVGFFDNFLRSSNSANNWFSGTDIAIFRSRMTRPDTEGNDMTGFSRTKPVTARRDERVDIAHQVIRRQSEYHRLTVTIPRECSSRGNRRTRVSPHRLKQYVSVDP